MSSLPGVVRWGVRAVLDYLAPIVEDGLSSVLLFGVPERVTKDEVGEVMELGIFGEERKGGDCRQVGVHTHVPQNHSYM